MSLSSDMQDVQNQIVNKVGYLTRLAKGSDEQAARASLAGERFASEVYRYFKDPERVGLDALREAYDEFMGHRAGGFRSTPRLPNE